MDLISNFQPGHSTTRKLNSGYVSRDKNKHRTSTLRSSTNYFLKFKYKKRVSLVGCLELGFDYRVICQIFAFWLLSLL